MRHVPSETRHVLEYLPCALSALKASGGWIHYYGFEHAAKTESPAEKVKLKVAETLDASGVDFEVPCVRVVRSTGPNSLLMCRLCDCVGNPLD